MNVNINFILINNLLEIHWRIFMKMLEEVRCVYGEVKLLQFNIYRSRVSGNRRDNKRAAQYVLEGGCIFVGEGLDVYVFSAAKPANSGLHWTAVF